jgi:RimJ/RimL family protein N-acetyltransferase
MVETRDGVSIGMCGILRRDTLEHPDLGFAFLPEYISKGYGFEIGSAVLTYAKNDLKFSTILAITLPANTKSIKLLEKIGFTFVKNFRADSTSEELLLYSA